MVRKEKMLEEEPERLELALRRCKKLTGTLVTLKRYNKITIKYLCNFFNIILFVSVCVSAFLLILLMKHRLACVQEQRLPIDGRVSPSSSQSSATAGPSSEEYTTENICANPNSNKVTGIITTTT